MHAHCQHQLYLVVFANVSRLLLNQERLGVLAAPRPEPSGLRSIKTTILNFHFILVVFRPLGNEVRDQDEMPLYISRVFCSHRALQPAVFSPLPAGFSQPILSALSPFQAESSQPFHLFFIWLKYLSTILHMSLSAIYYLGEFHRVAGRSNNFLILRQDCCLWSRRVSSGRGQKQQILDFETTLLPLVTASFIGS